MAWPRDAYVGQSVVCLKDPAPDEPPPYTYRGCVYTIKRIFVEEGWLLFLFEEVTDPDQYDPEWLSGFYSCYFRPVDPQKRTRSTDTGMSILHDLLNEQPARKPERERA